MSEQGQPQLDAEKRAQHLAEIGLDDPYEIGNEKTHMTICLI
jgi:hypothetical protein